MIPRTYVLRVAQVDREADDIKSFHLQAEEGVSLPQPEAGAHVDLHLPDGLVRSYSLIDWRADGYRIAVARDRASRGGSTFLHDRLAVGDRVTVAEPRNNFPLDEAAERTLFIAGGIGITPLYAMARRLDALGKPWKLLYCARHAAAMAFVPALQALHGEVVLWADDAHGGPPDLADHLAGLAPTTEVYCCGPLPMLQRFEALSAGLPPARIHTEYFSAALPADVRGGVTVTLARSHKVVFVPPGKTILDAVLDEGVDVPCSCMEGHCGTCEALVLAGTPDHRDVFLSRDQKARNDRMMICVSGALTDTLTLDL